MTTFVDVTNMARWAFDTGIESITTGMGRYLVEDFKQWDSFEKIPRVASHSPIGVIELMPISDSREYSFKYVNGHPSNPARGFQTVTAFGMLADVDNGYPTFVAEMTVLTALRTAAVSALVAKHLAREDSRVHALIGTGSQSEFQAIAMRGALGIDTLRIYDIDPAAMDKFVRNIKPLGFTIEYCASADEAVAGADVITVCTADKQHATVLHDSQVEPGVHLNAIGGDCPGKTELEASILNRSTVFVEFEEQSRIEGEIQQMPPDFPVVEFADVVRGLHPGRTSAEEITLFDSVGFAMSDFSALRYVRDAVAGTHYTDDIELIAEPDDPKDLFSLIVPSLHPVT